MGRPVFGRVYELNLADATPEEEHAYVGKVTAPTTIHQRVHGKSASAHTSSASIHRDPWKARILPGAAGYRLLEVVYATGDATADQAALRRAEAFWIDRLNTAYNDVRPVRPFATAQWQAPRPTPAARRPSPPRRKPRKAGKPLTLLAMVVAATWLAARLIVALHLPWPAAPWVGAPVLGVAVAWSTFWHLHRSVRKLLR